MARSALATIFAPAERGLESPDVGRWLDRIDADRENLRAAIAFAVAEREAGLRCGCAPPWRATGSGAAISPRAAR